MNNLKTDEIIFAIEFSLVGMYEQFDGLFNVVKRNEVQIIQFPQIDFWEFNRVGMTNLNDENADKIIKEVLKYYKKMGSNSISWIVGPLTTPPKFHKHLENNEFEFKETDWGMYLPTNASLNVKPLKDLKIKESKLKDLEREDVHKMIETAYGMPKGSGKLMKQFVQFFSKITKIEIFIAYDGEKPVAFGNLVIIPGTKGAVLGGAATLPEYRKRGIYSNLLKIRKEKAKELNVEYLVIQAKEKTSAPIAKKHGFVKLCSLQTYVYNPKS